MFVQVLWDEERQMKELTDKQSFIDLGCGNGLLVYILTAEGVCICSLLMLIVSVSILVVDSVRLIDNFIFSGNFPLELWQHFVCHQNSGTGLVKFLEIFEPS